MRRALIDPENSFLQNALGIVLFVPISLIAIIAVLPFAVFARPAKKTVSEVASTLTDMIEDTGDAFDWDDFISVPIFDPRLESVRSRASQIELPISEDSFSTLRALLTEVESLREIEH